MPQAKTGRAVSAVLAALVTTMVVYGSISYLGRRDRGDVTSLGVAVAPTPAVSAIVGPLVSRSLLLPIRRPPGDPRHPVPWSSRTWSSRVLAPLLVAVGPSSHRPPPPSFRRSRFSRAHAQPRAAVFVVPLLLPSSSFSSPALLQPAIRGRHAANAGAAALVC